MTTGERIREARIRKSMTQQQLAARLGLGGAAINKYETNVVVNLKRETIQQIAKALDVKPSYLMCWDDEPAPAVVREPDAITLSRAQLAFVNALRAMTSKQKAKVIAYMQQILEGSPE